MVLVLAVPWLIVNITPNVMSPPIIFTAKLQPVGVSSKPSYSKVAICGEANSSAQWA